MRKALVTILCLCLMSACDKRDNPAEQMKENTERAIGAAKDLAGKAERQAQELAEQANQAMGEVLDQAGDVGEKAEAAKRNAQLKMGSVSPLR